MHTMQRRTAPSVVDSSSSQRLGQGVSMRTVQFRMVLSVRTVGVSYRERSAQGTVRVKNAIHSTCLERQT